MPFHPNGLDHETLKKLAKNLRKGFPKIFPDVAIATHQSQALMAVALGYETWHEAITVRDPSLLPASTPSTPEVPTLEAAIEALHRAVPGGALVIPQWHPTVNTRVFAALREMGHEDDVLVLNPRPESSMLESRNTKVFMRLEDPTETFDLFQPSAPDAAASAGTVPSGIAASVADVRLWSDLPSAILVFEGFLAYVASRAMSLREATHALIEDLRALDQPGFAAYLVRHWAPAFDDQTIDRWSRTMAQVLMPSSRRAAHAVLRVARLSASGSFEPALTDVVRALQDSVNEPQAMIRGGQATGTEFPRPRTPSSDRSVETQGDEIPSDRI